MFFLSQSVEAVEYTEYTEAVEYTDSTEGKILSNECPGYDTKPSDGEAPVLEPWGMWNTYSLPLFLGPLWPGVVVPVRVPSMGQIELVSWV